MLLLPSRLRALFCLAAWRSHAFSHLRFTTAARAVLPYDARLARAGAPLFDRLTTFIYSGQDTAC